MNPIPSPHITAPGSVPTFDVFDMQVRVLISGAETNNSQSVLEIAVPPGAGTPLHTHTRESETFYVLAGTLHFVCGNQETDASSGTSIFAPVDVSHSYVNRSSAPARLLVICTPAGIENFFREAAALPPTAGDEAAAALCTRYGMTLP